MYDYAKVAGLFVSFSAVSAGFAFNAVVFLIRWSAPTDEAAASEVSRQRALLVLLVAMFDFIFTAFAYATINGLSATPRSVWFLGPFASFSIATSFSLLTLGVILLFDAHHLHYASRLASHIYDFGLLLLAGLVFSSSFLALTTIVIGDPALGRLPLSDWLLLAVPILVILGFGVSLSRIGVLQRLFKAESMFDRLVVVGLIPPVIATAVCGVVTVVGIGALSEAIIRVTFVAVDSAFTVFIVYVRVVLSLLLSNHPVKNPTNVGAPAAPS